jgi:CHAD domain-containing protein
MVGPPRRADSTDVLKQLYRQVFRQLPKALVGEEEPLHEMRVAARRLRVALPLVTRKPRAKKVKRVLSLLRGLLREAGASRDLDVCTSLLAERVKEQDPPSPTLKALLKRIRAARNRSRGRMAEGLLDLDLAGLRHGLRGCAAQGGEELFAVLQRLRGERTVRGEGLILALENLGERYDPEALHEIRISCRRLRYALELADTLKAVESGQPAVLKELQGQLGRIHDDHVVAEWLMNEGGRAGERGQVDLEIEAARQEAFFLERGRKRHREFLDSDPKARIRTALGLGTEGSPHSQPVLGSPRVDR